MNIIIREPVSEIGEEIWYLAHNKKFQSQLKIIRKKFNVPEKGLVVPEHVWLDENLIKDPRFYIRFSNRIHNIIKRSRLIKSKYSFDAWYTLKNFILFNEISSVYSETKVPSLPYPTIETTPERIIVTMSIFVDSTLSEAQKLLKSSWSEVRKNQEAMLAQQKRISTSDDFKWKADIWCKRYETGKTESQIYSQMFSNETSIGHKVIPVEPSEIRKLLKRMDNRIRASYQ